MPAECERKVNVKKIETRSNTFMISLQKLNRFNALLSIIRNYVNTFTLRTIYFAIFDSHINYANVIWGKKSIFSQ